MTVSTHSYTAELIGSPDIELSVLGGRITLDAGSAPHVQASLTIPKPSMELGEALDVRTSPPPRVRITADAVFPTETQSRVFDLTLRTRPIALGAAECTLELASDEALIQDYAPLDDIDLTDTADLAALCEAVILEATGVTVSVTGETADITPLWDATNVLSNPSLEVDAAEWGAGVGASALARVAVGGVGPVGSWGLRWDPAAGDSDVYPHSSIAGSPTASPGRIHTFGVQVQSTVATSARVTMRFYGDDAGAFLLASFDSDYQPTSTSGWTKFVVQGQAPSLATHVFCYIHTVGNAGTEQHFADAAYVIASEFDPGYFDGDTTDTAEYAYAWTGTAHASASTRTALSDAPEPDALVWDAGQNGMDFLHPLVQMAGLRLVCNEAREWTLRNEGYSAPGSIAIRHTVNMIDADDVMDRDDDRWFDAAVTRYTWTDIYGVEQVRVDSYGMMTYSRCRLFEKDTAYPGPGFSEYAVRRAQGRGRTVTATAVADWRAAAEQAVTVILAEGDTLTARTDRVEFDLDRDEMSVTTRTVETAEGSIDSLVGTIDSLTGTIDSL